MANQEIKLGKYKHFKSPDKEYEVIGVAYHSETLEKMVIYRALYESTEFGKNAIWARPIESFTGIVEVDGKEMPRFEYIGE